MSAIPETLRLCLELLIGLCRLALRMSSTQDVVGSGMLGLLLCLALVYPVSCLVRGMVEEKETRMRETLCALTPRLPEPCYPAPLSLHLSCVPGDPPYAQHSAGPRRSCAMP